MTDDIKLLPMPEGKAAGMYQAWSYDQMQAYARANIARAIAVKDAEIEQLRESLATLKAENEMPGQTS